MSKYIGDFAEDVTLDFKFTSVNTSQVPTTLSGTPVVKVYKDNATATESTAGITLTVDFDSVTGLNNLRIDTSADAFYATGANYQAVITTGTVGGVSVVGVVVCTFSIENRYTRGTDNALEPTTAGRKLDVTTGGAAGIDWGNIENKTTANDLSATDIQLCDTTTAVTNEVTADVTKVSGDATAADNLELDYDGTGYNKSASTIGTCTTNTDMITVANILTTQMTEAYAADGTAPTLAQAIFLIQQSLHEFAITSTTRTVKKLNGSDTAATFTLDDATSPTSTTRAS
jgi:hypothetical protein